jgi:hypothetical protein
VVGVACCSKAHGIRKSYDARAIRDKEMTIVIREADEAGK